MTHIVRDTPEAFCKFADLENDKNHSEYRQFIRNISQDILSNGLRNRNCVNALNEFIGRKHTLDYLRVCNGHVRKKFFSTVQEVFLNFYKSEIEKPDTYFYQFTIICESMTVNLLSPKPNLPKIRERVRSPFRKYELEGLGMIEFDLIRNYGKEKKRVLSFHFHGILRSKKKLSIKKLKSSITRFRSTISPRAIDVKLLSIGEKHFLRSQSYFFKPVGSGKLRCNKSKKLSDIDLERCERLRIFETNSLMTVTDLLIGFGKDGNRMKREISKSMTEWSRENGGVGVRACFQEDTKKVWRKIRKELGLSHYDDVNIIRRR